MEQLSTSDCIPNDNIETIERIQFLLHIAQTLDRERMAYTHRNSSLIVATISRRKNPISTIHLQCRWVCITYIYNKHQTHSGSSADDSFVFFRQFFFRSRRRGIECDLNVRVSVFFNSTFFAAHTPEWYGGLFTIFFS